MLSLKSDNKKRVLKLYESNGISSSPTRLQILIFCKRDKKDISFQDNYVYLQAEQENEKCRNRSKWNKTALSY